MHTFSLEYYLKRGAAHLENLVDAQGRTYFAVFKGEPAEAVTDWPDFVDVAARYWEAAALVEPVVGRPVETCELIRKRLFSYFAEDGLCYRPDTAISRPIAELFDQSRLLYALVTWGMHAPEDKEVRTRIRSLISGLRGLATFQDDYAFIKEIGVYFGGTLIRPLVQAGQLLGDEEIIEFARLLVRGIVYHSDHFALDGSFKGHVHGHLGTLAGILALGVLDNDVRLIARSRQIFEYARGMSTEFGFVPEGAQRKDDLIACETCAIMDYLDVALLLARHVDPAYWEVVEKTARNHLVESQVAQQPWLCCAQEAEDEDGVIRSDLAKRLEGSFAGWSGPHTLLAYEESLWEEWVKTPEMYPRYLGRVRAIQNCCAGAGIRAIHQVWNNITTVKDGVLSLNLLMDKEIPEAKVTSYVPYEGKIVIEVKKGILLKVRIPSDLAGSELAVARNGAAIHGVEEGFFLNLGSVEAGDQIEIRFPLKEEERPFSVGNEGFQQYHFNARWKGDTVLSIRAAESNPTTGYSYILKEKTRVFAEDDVPGRMYRRDELFNGAINSTPYPCVLDQGRVDWYSLK